ncbi:MAG: hypothetical protein EXS42_04615 [Lacunisphaera sp.]|nr:hypothetical protein [Lacunisphaera sp.]
MKIGLDDDDDLFVRVELKPKSIDLQEFKFLVRQNIKAAEAVRGGNQNQSAAVGGLSAPRASPARAVRPDGSSFAGMMNADSAPPPPLERHLQPARKHSGFGMTSFVIGVLGGLFQAGRYKVFAVIGVVINSIILAGTTGRIVLGNEMM